MDPGLFDQILRDLAGLSERPKVIYFGYLGETLLDKHFQSRIESVTRHDLAAEIDILTNASFLDEEKSLLIAEANIGKITIGFDGATREVYEKHRVNCTYDSVLRNIKQFVDIRNRLESKTRIVVQYVRTLENAHEVRSAYEMFGCFLKPGHDYFQDNISKDWASAPLIQGDLVTMHAPNHRGNHGYCPRFGSELVVHCDGNIASCCWDYNLDIAGALDNITNKTVLDVWRGHGRERLERAMRSSNLSEKPEKCRECVFLYNPTDVPMSEAAIEDESLIQSNAYALVYHFPKAANS
jgi:radical SAM protein with 4Fe4S-binding SPASM domain